MYSRLLFRTCSPSLLLNRCLTLSRVQAAAAPQLQEKIPSTVEAINAEKANESPSVRDKTYSEKIHRLVDEISRLSLVDVMDLNELLKVSGHWHAAPPLTVCS